MSVSVEYLQRLLQELAGQISLEELRLAKYKEAVGARWSALRLGQIKRLYNLIEMRQLVFLKLTFPHRTFYGQAVFAALELPNRTLIPLAKGQKLPVLELPDGSFIAAPKRGEATPKGAKLVTLPKGRIADILEISGTGDDLQTYELKTKNAIVDSAGRASDVHDIETESFKPKRAVTIQTNVERVIQKAARALNAKVLVQCNDPISGISVLKKIGPNRFPVSHVMAYGQIPDRLAKQAPGFIKLTLDKVTKPGNIHLDNSKMSRLPQPSQEAIKATANPSGRPTLDQRGTAKVSVHGPVETVGGGSESKLQRFANRVVESKGVGTAMRVLGRVNLVLAPIGIHSLAKEFSGEAESEQFAREVAAELNIDNYKVGEVFTVAHGGYDFRIRVEAMDQWPHNLPSVPKKKRFVFLRATPSDV
jgi:hypothetical protein